MKMERVLTEWAARDELLAAGIAFTPCERVATDDEAVAAAARIGYPVVVKVQAADIVHKTEVNGVHVDLRNAGTVRVACVAIRDAVSRAQSSARLHAPAPAFLVQPFVRGGIDIFLGAARDSSFGPYLLLGLGGVWVEVLDDVVAVALPATPADVMRALRGLRAFVLLTGARGQRGVDLDALVKTALLLGDYMMRTPAAVEVDVNPLRVFGDAREDERAIGLDARIVMSDRCDAEKPVPERRVLDALLDPRGVVVVGASKDNAKFGSRLVRSLLSHGFDRPLWALHPRDSQVQGIPAYPSAAASPHGADLAYITVEGRQVATILKDVAQAGVRAAVVFASGFGESGPEGEAMQTELTAAAREAGIGIVGPNTPGIVSVPANMYGSFVGTMSMQPLPDGDIVLLTQSGSIGSALMGRGWDRGLAFRAWVATGDEADICVEHLLDYYAGDPGTRVIAIFVEMIRDGRRFRQAARRARAAGKVLVVYAIGRSEAGLAAIQSHTGSLGGNHRLYDAVFRQDGVARVADLDEMLDAIQALDWCPLPAGPRVTVVSSSGASCGIAADDCEANGLVLPPLTDGCKQRLSKILPSFAATNNPLDLTAEIVTRPALMADALAAVIDQGTSDMLLITLGTQQGPMALEVGRAIVDLRSRVAVPIVISRLGADSLNAELLTFYRDQKLPLFSTPTRAARALRHLVQQAASAPPGEPR